MAYKIVNNWTPSSKYNIKAPYAMSPKYITVHNTGNTASARNEISYMNSNNNQTSYHVAIDDKEVVQAIPFNRNAWHAGDGNRQGNRASIGIEICYSMDNGYSGAKSSRYSQAEENTALYIAHVLKQYGWGIDRLKRHYDWSGKDCPHKMHATGTYQAFRNRVQAHLNALNKGSTVNKPITSKPTPKPAKKYNVKDRDTWGWHWSGTLTVTAKAGLQVYASDQFMRVKNQVAKSSNLAKGDFVNFDHVFLINGHWQVRFKYAAKGSSTNYFFVPIGEKKHGQTLEQAIKANDLWVKVEKLNTNESKSGVTNWHKKGAVK